MIVKLCRMGGYIKYVDAHVIVQQELALGQVDLEIMPKDGMSTRAIISNEPEALFNPETYNRAYIMENGRTVDTIQQSSPKPQARK